MINLISEVISQTEMFVLSTDREYVMQLLEASLARSRGGSRTAATSKMECFVIIVNGFQPLTIITKRSILDVATVLDPPLRRDEIVDNHAAVLGRSGYYTEKAEFLFDIYHTILHQYLMSQKNQF